MCCKSGDCVINKDGVVVVVSVVKCVVTEGCVVIDGLEVWGILNVSLVNCVVIICVVATEVVTGNDVELDVSLFDGLLEGWVVVDNIADGVLKVVDDIVLSSELADSVFSAGGVVIGVSVSICVLSANNVVNFSVITDVLADFVVADSNIIVDVSVLTADVVADDVSAGLFVDDISI